MQAGILTFHKNLRPLSEIKEAFLKIIGTLFLLYFDEKRGSNNLVQALDIETTSYLQQFDTFSYHTLNIA